MDSLLARANSLALNGALVYTLVALMSPGFRSHTEKDRALNRLEMGLESDQDVFDFIIVGAGSCGCSLASYLSENHSVLVLEAGAAPSPLHYVPFWAYLQFNIPAIDWAYKTEPQRNACFGMNDNSSLWPAGKLLGGSSLLNGMINIRGNVQGFDEIASKTGDARWSTENMLKYYKAQENYDGWFQDGDHGIGGPLNIGRSELPKFQEFMNKAGEELGYKIRDPNPYGPYTEGFSNMELYMKGGRRSDAYHSLLLPATFRNSRNLVVRRFSHVTKVLFRGQTTKAIGVEYLRHGKLTVAKAKKEVILSAGALRTPQILMLSGIGPKEHLEEIGIKSKVDLPVGQTLQDKYGALIGPFLVKEGYGIVYERDISPMSFVEWLTTGNGIMRTALSAGTWAAISEEGKRLGRTSKPDLHTYVLAVTMPEEILSETSRAFNLKPEVAQFYSKAGKIDSFFQLVTLNHPMGQGTIRLRDKNPLSYPMIDPHYLENDVDSKTLLDGLKLAVQLVENTTAMGETMNGKLMPGHFPGCEAFETRTDGYYECVMRHATITAFKYGGTAPVGRSVNDPEAVVDSEFRVLGTRRLRVVDGSVLQEKHVSVNDVTCRMLGKFAADMISGT